MRKLSLTIKLSLAAALVLAGAVLSACSESQGDRLAAGGQARPELPAGFSLPAPSALAPRHSSVTDAIALSGSVFDELLPNANTAAIGPLAVFSPTGASGLGSSAYAIYQFNLAEEATAFYKLTLDWQTDPPGGWFVGIANFEFDRWEWRGSDAFAQFPPLTTTRLDSLFPDPHVDTQNLRALVAVVVVGDSPGELEQIHFNNFDPVIDGLDVPASGQPGVDVEFTATASDVDNTNLFYSWDFGDGNTLLSQSSGSAVHAYINPGLYEVVLTVQDSEGGAGAISAPQNISIAGADNDPPVVALSGNGETESLLDLRPLSVNFSAPASDPDGSIARYEWDFDGDGEFELDSGTVSEQQHLYTALGVFAAAVRVTDNEGAQAIDSISVSTEGGAWAQQDIAQVIGHVLGGIKADIIAGRPAVVYADMPSDFSDSDVMYVRATSDDGDSAWGAPVLVEADAGGSLFGPQLNQVNGKPAVLYSLSGSTLFYEQSPDGTGVAWDTARVEVGSSFTGSLAIVDGFPAASYGVFAMGEVDLRYRRASDADGLMPWGSEVVVDTSSSTQVGGSSALGTVNNIPALVYNDATNGRLLYKFAFDSTGSAWGDVSIISEGGSSTGLACFMEVVGARAAVAFCETSAKLAYSRADSVLGDSWPETPVQMGPNFINASVFGLGLYKGIPCIACQDFTAKSVVFVLAQDTLGSAWNDGEVIGTHTEDSGNIEGSLVILANGQPAVAWCAPVNDTVHYVVYK